MRSIITCCLLFVITFVKASDSTYTESPVTLHTATGDIFGTLTLPNAPTKQVVLIIAGSGATDRNGNNPTMKNESLRMLAHFLAENNIASLRYDKRGVAESIGAMKSELTLRFDHYVNDANEWLTLLKNDKRFSKVGIIGHSEGSLIGMIAAKNKADYFISVAGAGRKADVILREQLAAQPPLVKKLSDPILDSLSAGLLVKEVNPFLNALFRPNIQPYLISWFAKDPQLLIGQLQIPVLIVQGENDIQVSVNDAQFLSDANKKATLKIIPHMNHVLKDAEKDRAANMKTYNDPSLPLNKDFTAAILQFLQHIQ